MIFIFADTIVSWRDLRNSLTGEPVNDATIVAVLQAPTSYTFDLEFQAGSNGDYVGTIPAAVTEQLQAGKEYLLEITAHSATAQDYRRESHLAQYRGFSA